MSTTSIEDPFQLASYTSSSRWKGKKSTLDHVYTSQLNSSLSKSRREGYVTVSTQADGIHILDVSTLHPLVSHTLGPSTSFSCPAITTETSPSYYSTYAVIESSPELRGADEAGRVIWKWTQQPGSVSSVTDSQKKTSRVAVPTSQRIHSLHSDPTLPKRILALTTTATLLVLDAETLEEKAKTEGSSEASSDALQVFVFPSGECSLSPSTGVTVAIASSTEASLFLRILSIDEGDAFTVVGDFEFSHKHEQIAGVSFSNSGCLSVLSKDGEWHAYALASSDNNSSTTPARPRPLATPLRLNNFSFAALKAAKSSAKATSPLSIVALTSSHVLLAATSPSSSDIHIQVWDLQYSVLLATHTLPVPAAFASTPLNLRFGTHRPVLPSSSSPLSAVYGQAVLVLSPASSSKQESSAQNVTSSVLVVPYAVAAQSTIAAALGRAGVTKQWLKPMADSAAAGQGKSPADSAKSKMLNAVRTALEGGRTKTAESTFSSWLTEAETATKASSKSAEKASTPPAPVFAHGFVKEIVDLVLPPLKSTGKAPYQHSAEILKALLERNLVFNGMVEGGILPALRARNDWASIELSLSSINDLPINDIVDCLVSVIQHHRNKAASDSMDVDSEPSTPTLPAFLALVINYVHTTTPSQIIIALKRHLRDSEDVAAVAQTLVTWIRALVQQRKNTDLGVWPSNKDMEQNEHGVLVYNPQSRDKRMVKNAAKKAGGPPVFERVIAFLQPFLDACFLPLLQHPPSHPLLHELQNSLIEESALSELLLQLQGSLEPFSVSHQKALREAAIPQREREKQRQKGDWRARRGGAAGVIGNVGTVGVYQLEELAF
ncbi:hypothetical protein CC2G_010007 [Coprinopsis cinerea AmutBmut pab1-1]|nr:hypothetical protein CC2G_010007 [Coprinopsis cinerea AmutBmut pab1-1]